MDWFIGLAIEIKVAIISACGLVLVAIVNGIFSLLGSSKKKNKDETRTTTITQTTTGNNNTVIGVQNNITERDE